MSDTISAGGLTPEVINRFLTVTSHNKWILQTGFFVDHRQKEGIGLFIFSDENNRATEFEFELLGGCGVEDASARPRVEQEIERMVD